MSNRLIFQVRSSDQSSTGDSAPSEARKRGSGGGSPRKHDDLLTEGGLRHSMVSARSAHTKAPVKRATGRSGGLATQEHSIFPNSL
jgi:hypothetical protein